MTVWIVERCYDYEGCVLIGVFSSELLALRHVASEAKSGSGNLHVEAWEVDGMVSTSASPGDRTTSDQSGER